MSDTRHGGRDGSGDLSPWLGLLAGGLVLLLIMGLVAGVAVALGWIVPNSSGPPDLRRWLQLEIAAGFVASALGGAVSRRVAGSARGPALLAWFVLGVGLLEAATITGLETFALSKSPGGWQWIAPIAGAIGVVLGAWLAGRRTGAAQPRARVRGEDVRTRRAPWIILLPALAAGYSLSLATIPPDQRTLLNALRWVIVPAEIALIVYLVSMGRRAMRAAPRTAGDFADRFRAAARAALAARVPADIIATEVSILYYALRPGRSMPSEPGDFSSHRSTGYSTIVLGLVLLLLVEVIPLHVLVSRWTGAGAWILTALSVYALLWLLGDLRALSARPTRLRPDRLSVRIGLRWEAEIPIECIERVEAAGPDPAGGGSDRVKLTLVGPPNAGLRLNAPVEVTGMYGIRRSAREVWLQVDRPADFLAALRTAMTRRDG